MRVFVTGHRGYICAHLVDVLRAAGHEITGCNLELFADCAWREPVAPDRELAFDEGDPMHPLTAHARSKIDTEGALFALAPAGQMERLRSGAAT